ncbi:hypothetical protein AURDEDRAFT_159449 [Auricularia subglabra TFB-10046 SS5]|nr:hypothetical protein AURDEDRAFT_159449 [Auricularia subglabra TFB-10046 SS5]
MLAEPGGLRRRGSWLRAYVARGGEFADFDGVCEWLLDLGPELELEPAKDGKRGLIDVRPLRVLLRRAILASKGVSALAPLDVREQILRSRLEWARAEMLPPAPWEPAEKAARPKQEKLVKRWTPTEPSQKDSSREISSTA